MKVKKVNYFLGICSQITIDNCVEIERIATDLQLEDVKLNIGKRNLSLSSVTKDQGVL